MSAEHNTDVRNNIRDSFRQMQVCFKLMNWYASGECMNNFSGTDPNALLGEVYFQLASAFHAIKQVMKDLDIDQEELTDEQVKMETRTLDLS